MPGPGVKVAFCVWETGRSTSLFLPWMPGYFFDLAKKFVHLFLLLDTQNAFLKPWTGQRAKGQGASNTIIISLKCLGIPVHVFLPCLLLYTTLAKTWYSLPLWPFFVASWEQKYCGLLNCPCRIFDRFVVIFLHFEHTHQTSCGKANCWLVPSKRAPGYNEPLKQFRHRHTKNNNRSLGHKTPSSSCDSSDAAGHCNVSLLILGKGIKCCLDGLPANWEKKVMWKRGLLCHFYHSIIEIRDSTIKPTQDPVIFLIPV